MSLTNRASPSDDYVYMAYARGLLDYLAGKGFASHELLAHAAIDPGVLDDPQAVISSGQYSTLWQSAEALTHDPQLGLHVGEIVRPGKYGILGYAMMSSSTLQDALERQRRYQDLVGKSGRSELTCQGPLAVLKWESPLAALSPHISEEHLASWITFARTMLGSDKRAIVADFMHPPPAELGEHQRIFNCELRFRQPCTAISFPREYLSMPLREKNPELQALLDQHANQSLLQLKPTDDQAIDQVRRTINDLLLEGTPAIETVAARLDTAPRSLQRRLSNAGWSYKELLDDLRRNLAVEYMRDGQLSILDIAFTLGFAEQSSFQRAFKRWTGQTPGQYRQQISGKAP